MSNHDEYQQAIQTLKKNHVRITPQRQIILKYLITHHNHPSVETIYHDLSEEFSNLSVATIYNNLRMLEEHNIIIELPSRDGGVRFDFYGTPHFHAICENCGKIFDIKYEQYAKLNHQLAALTEEQVDFTVTNTKVEVFGICHQCKLKQQSKE